MAPRKLKQKRRLREEKEKMKLEGENLENARTQHYRLLCLITCFLTATSQAKRFESNDD